MQRDYKALSEKYANIIVQKEATIAKLDDMLKAMKKLDKVEENMMGAHAISSALTAVEASSILDRCEETLPHSYNQSGDNEEIDNGNYYGNGAEDEWVDEEQDRQTVLDTVEQEDAVDLTSEQAVNKQEEKVERDEHLGF